MKINKTRMLEVSSEFAFIGDRISPEDIAIIAYMQGFVDCRNMKKKTKKRKMRSK